MLVSEAVDAARFDYPVGGGDLLGLLVEPARTNMLVRSGELDNGSWSKGGNTTVTGNHATGIDGGTTAARIQMPSGSGTAVTQNITLGNSLNYCFSAYAKRTSGASNINLVMQSSLVSNVAVDEAAGVNFAAHQVVGVSDADGGLCACVFDNTTPPIDILVAHAQVEAYAANTPPRTNPIPTTTAAVTRAADILTLSLTDGGWSLAVVTPNGVFSGEVTVSGGAYPFSWADLTGAGAERHIQSITATQL